MYHHTKIVSTILLFVGLAEAKFQFYCSNKKYFPLPPYLGKETYDSHSSAILVNRFESNQGQDLNMTLEEWLKWKGEDGFLCRTHRDCDWLDVKLYCQNYKVELGNPWFGIETGNYVDGYCACPLNYIWDDGQVECRKPTWLELYWLLLLILLVIAILYLIHKCSEFNICDKITQFYYSFHRVYHKIKSIPKK